MHLVTASLVLLTACAGSRPVEQPEPPPVAPPDFLAGTLGADAADATMSPAVAGQLDESEFKALHVLEDGQPPALSGEMVTLSDGSAAYLSLPPGAVEPGSAVLVVHEWWGLNDHIKHYADRLALDGHAALAVDLYGGVVATDADTAMATMKAVDPGRARSTLDAGLTLLREDPRFVATRLGVIGWCFGGGWSLDTALRHPDLAASVVYYGKVETDPTALAALDMPLLGIFGTQDEGIPVATIDAFEAALKQAGKDVEIRRYEATHAFANPSNAHYDEAAAGDAWERVRAFLRQHLGD